MFKWDEVRIIGTSLQGTIVEVGSGSREGQFLVEVGKEFKWYWESELVLADLNF